MFFLIQVEVHLFHLKHIMLHEVQKDYIQKYKKSRIYKKEKGKR